MPYCTVPDAGCPNCGARVGHYSTCISSRLNKDVIVSRSYTGSEIGADDAPCDECMGYYQHDVNCSLDAKNKIARHPNWSLVRADECKICFRSEGHSDICPMKMFKCDKCGRPAIIGHRCPAPEPCKVCAQVNDHAWPCTQEP